MEKKSKTGGRGQLPDKSAQIPPADQTKFDDEGKVLEHVSSSFRWELLEVSPIQPKKFTPNKSTHQKPGTM